MSDTILTLTIPQLVCARAGCGATAPVVPVMLKRGNGANAITDSMGNSWMQSGAQYPRGWTQANGRDLCDGCTAALEKSTAAFFAPPPPPAEEPRRDGVGVATRYMPPIKTGQTVAPIPAAPVQAQGGVRVTHEARAVLPASHPAPVVTNRAAPAAGTVSGVRSVEQAPAQPQARVTGNVVARPQPIATANTPRIAADRSLVKNTGGSQLPNLHPATSSPTPSKPIEPARVRLSDGE